MAVKNVVFRFTADTSQILRIIDDLNKAIAKTQNSLASFKIAANSKQIEQQLAAINKKLEIQADTKTARKELIELNKEIVRVQKTAAAPVKIGFLDNIKSGLAALGIVAGIDAVVQFGKESIQAAINFENLTASFRALIGDKELADQKIKEIQQFALATPFDVTEIAAAAKTLLGYGINANDLLPIIKQLGDVSAASGGDIQRVALAFGQVAAKGKLQGEEIRQLVNIGFNPLQEISKQTGESMAALAKRVEAGKVSFEEVAEAFKIATSEGGRFFELAATLNQTFGGQLQKLSEQINLFKIEVGTALATELRPLVITTSEFFQSLTENAKAIRENVLAMGALKATLAFVISLLFKSANAYVANILSLKTWSALITATQKQIVAFTLALRINTIATGASTTAQKAAAVATTLWDGATKALTVGINFLSGAAKALWATIAANPIGTIIAAYYLWNSLIEENIKKTRENILAQNNLRDARTIIKDYDLQASGAIQAVSGSLEDQRKQIVDAITTNGILSDTAQEYIKRLEEQEKINLSAIKGYKDQSRAIRELNTLFDKLKERKAVEVKVTEAENSLQELRIALGKTDKLFTQFLDARETFGGNYFEFLKQEKERGPIFENFVSSAEKANTAIGKIKGFFGLPEKINTIPVPLRSQPLKEQRDIYLKLIDEYLNKIKEKENQLADLKTKLFGFGLDRPGKGKEPFKAEKDALSDLIRFIQKLKDEIDDLNDKQVEFQIGQMPELSEQDQRAKAYARYDFEVKQNERLKQERIAALNTELEEARKKGASKTKLEELEKEGLAKINQRYAASQLLEYNKLGAELDKINEYWRGEDKRIRDLYLNESIDEELRQRERLTEGLQEDIDKFLVGFEKAPIGSGKRYRETFMGYESALKDSINRQEDLESMKRDLQYFNDKAALEKRYGNEERYANDKNVALNQLKTKWEQDSLAIKNKFDDLRFKTDEDNANKFKASEQARLDYLYGIANESVKIATDTANQIIDIEIRKNDVLIELQKKRVEEARDIAEQGNAALLEAEEKRLNELQKKRAKFVRAQQALIFAQTAAESVLAVARSAAAGGPLSPILVATTIATLVTGFLAAKAASKNAIEGFDKGGWTGSGDRLEPAGIVHKEEFVVKKGPAAKFRPLLEEINRGRDPFLAAGVGQQVIMINNVGVEDRLNRIEKAIIGQDRMQLTIDESGIHGIVSHYQWKNQRIRNRAK